MGDYSKKLGRGRHGPHGKKPAEEGIGFHVEFHDIPGQEGTDDPVVMYKVTDRFDGELVLFGCEVASKASDVAERQVFLITKAAGVAGNLQLFRTDLKGEDAEEETEG